MTKDVYIAGLNDGRKSLEAEIARLRAALEAIKQNDCAQKSCDVYEIARKALAKEGGMNLDEIEQMRLLQRQNCTAEQFTIKALEAEIARLRAALEKIADPSTSWGHMKLIARDVLAKEGK